MSEPISLGFDTAAAHCAAALLRGDRVLAMRHDEMARGQAEHLFPMLQTMLDDAGLGWSDLDVIGVGIGPGNFTGIRVAVAAARGLALALKIPAIGVGAIEAAAFDLPRPCRLVLPARGGQVFWQDFQAGDVPAAPVPSLGDPDALPPGPPVLNPRIPVGEAIARLALARRSRPMPPPAPVYLRPADAAPARDAPPVLLAD